MEKRIIKVFSMVDEEANEDYEITVLETEEEYQMVFENQKTGKCFGFKFLDMDDIWDVLATFFIKFHPLMEFGGESDEQ